MGEVGEERSRPLQHARHLADLVVPLHRLQQEATRGCAHALLAALQQAAEGEVSPCQGILQVVPLAGPAALRLDAGDLVTPLRQPAGLLLPGPDLPLQGLALLRQPLLLACPGQLLLRQAEVALQLPLAQVELPRAGELLQASG